MKYDTSNEMFSLAVELVNNSSRNIFLTGKAGTGKTTFLKYIRENSPKQMAVVAPTGVAAINAGGVTIHSFFQLPLSPFVPGLPDQPQHHFDQSPGSRDKETVSRHDLLSRLRINSEKIKVLQELELLVIDEISMVRCDTVDAIDTVLRHIRKRPFERFGGVQVLFIGDMFQLPPVIRNQEWSLLSPFYNSPYFFDSLVVREEPPLYIEFTKIYRQSEEHFIRLLNQVRNNELDEEGRQLLDDRFEPGSRQNIDDGYIILTTHNGNAREINSSELQKIQLPLFSYAAQIDAEFPENAYPADELLQLKVGAQVMFIKNDLDRAKRYFNGKIGRITRLEKEKIVVQCATDPEIEVKKEKWENVHYTIDKTSRQINTDVLGSFSQYPLRLAWAITIHKSQGLTFEKAIIDAGDAFAPGQVYVALSRCTSLAGVLLKSKVRPSSLITDARIRAFSSSNASATELTQELEASGRRYLEHLLLSSFDLGPPLNNAKELLAYTREFSTSFNPESLEWILQVWDKINTLQEVALKFQRWLQQQFLQPMHPADNPSLQERAGKAAEHFSKEIRVILDGLSKSPAVTDSRLHAKEYNDTLRELHAALAFKHFLFQVCGNNWKVKTWQEAKLQFTVPSFSFNSYGGTSQQPASAHPALHQQLRKVRDRLCAQTDMAIYLVAGSKSLDEMAEYLPLTPDELEQVTGFGKVKVEKFGEQFLEVIRDYCDENDLSSRMIDKEPKQKKKPPKEKTGKPKTDTKAESLRLHRMGLPLTGIATERKLTIQTIEGHLAFFITNGEIRVEEVLAPDKLSVLTPLIEEANGQSLTAIKEKAGAGISFGEIRLAMAWQAFRDKAKESER